MRARASESPFSFGTTHAALACVLELAVAGAGAAQMSAPITRGVHVKRLILLILSLIAPCLLLSSPELAVGKITPHSAQNASSCAVGRSYTGCALPASAYEPAISQGQVGRSETPDVSDNNGPVDWSSVKRWQLSHGWTPSGIFKMGEIVTDPLAEANASELHTLGMLAIGYWFVRPTGCRHEAGQIVQAARVYGVKVVANDTEVAGLSGYPSCLAKYERAAGLIPVDYTAAGTFFADDPLSLMVGIPLWDATYGPAPDLAGLWTTHPAAWQFTENAVVPGIRTASDLSQNLGLLELAAPKPPPNVMHYERYDTTPHLGGIVERSTVESWDRDKCVNPVRRTICRTLHARLILLRDRLLGLHAAGKPWSYGSPWNIGARNQQLYHRIVDGHVITSWEAGL